MHFPELEHLLRGTYVFSRLPAAELARLERAFTLHVFQAGETIVKRGQPAHGWHIVSSGRVRVFEQADAGSAAPVILDKGDTFGSRSLIEAGVSPYTVRAESSVTLLELSRSAFESFAHESSLITDLQRRIERHPEFEFLKRLRIFSHLTPEQIEEMVDVLPGQSFPARAVVFREDDPSECCYLVRRGRIQLLKHVDQAVKRLATRREGDLVGEMELLYGTPRIADAVVDAGADVLVLSKDLFDRFMPEGGAREVIFQVATERLLQYQNMLSEVDTPADSARLPTLSLQWVRVPGRRLSRPFPIVAETSALGAGLACLAMIDGFHRRESAWQDRLEQLLWERQPDTLLSVSRKIEACGYFTRLITPRADQLQHLGLPGIIEDEDGTPAVLFEIDRDGAVVANPLRGIRRIDRAEFESRWNGQLLVVMPPETHEHGVMPIWTHLPQLAAMAFTALLIDVFGLGAPFAGKAVVDRVLGVGDLSMLRLLLVGVLVLVGFQLLASALRDYLRAYATRHAGLSLQRRFLHHILHLRQSVAASQQLGDLAVRFRENEALAERAFDTGLALLADTAAVVLYLVAIWWLSTAASVIALTFVAAYAGVAAAASPLVQRLGRRSGEARQAVQSHVIEAVSGIQTIKALAAERAFFERGRKLMWRLKADEFRATRVTASLELVGGVLHLAAIAGILGVGAHLAVTGAATTGDMVASLGLFGAMIVPLNGLIEARDGVRAIRSTSTTLAEVFRLESEAAPLTTVPPVIQGHVVFKDVAFRYPGATEDVLSDINLEVLPGQRVALVGRSGSGKTTLINLLTGLYEPTRGNIYIDHVEIASIPKAALRRQIGIVDQHPFLFEGTVRDNIGKADPSLPLDRIAAVAALAGAHEFIDALPDGYDTPVGERGTLLSGGEKQRLMIARALVSTPRMLVLDEATSAVDSGTESVIQRNIRQATEGRTTFVIAHRLSTVRDADLVVVLDRGRIVEAGTHVDLMSRRGLYFYLNTRTA